MFTYFIIKYNKRNKTRKNFNNFLFIISEKALLKFIS